MMKKEKIYLLVFLLLVVFVLAACGGNTPVSTTESIELVLNPATKALTNTLSLCDMSIPEYDYHFYYSEIVEESLSYFHFGEPNGDLKQYIPIGYDDIAILLNMENSVQSLSLTDIQAIFHGGIYDWQALGGSGAPIQVYIYAYDSELQIAFERFVMQSQSITTTAVLVDSIETMKEKVAVSPNAIGFVPASFDSSGFKSFDVGVRIPLLAARGTKTPYAIDKVLSCLQSDAMQVILLTDFADNIK